MRVKRERVDRWRVCRSVSEYIVCVCIYLFDHIINLQSILDCIDTWCTKWGLTINPQKTKAMHFRNVRKPQSNVTLHIGSKPLEYCHQYKYLGFWINEHLNMHESLQKVFDKANKALGIIIAKSKALGGFPFSVFTKLFNVSVVSIFSYIAHIWAFSSSPLCSKIENSALRFFFGLGRNTPMAALIGDSGWPPLFLQLQFTVMKYWYHLGTLNSDRLPKKIFCWNMKLADKGKKSWVFHVRSILSSIDSSSIVFDSKTKFYDTLWSALAAKHLTSWKKDVYGSEVRASPSGGRLVVYRQLKNIPLCEPYVRAGLDVGVRRVIAGLRAGCLPLQVELGRYTSPKTEYNLRLCKLCNNEVETQEHFLIRCSPLKEVRSELFKCLVKQYPDFLSLPDQTKCLLLLDPRENIYSTCKQIF